MKLTFQIILTHFFLNALCTEITPSGRVLTRNKRYLKFPDGSSLQLTYCMTVLSVGLRQIISLGITAGIAWELPTEAEKVLEIFGLKKTTTSTTTEKTTTEKVTSPLIVDWNEGNNHYYNQIEKVDYYWNDNNPFKKYMKHANYFANELNYADDDLDHYNHYLYHQVHRRTRRDLYGKIESLINSLNRDGRSCLLKAICEVSQSSTEKGTFFEEIVKTIFSIKPHEDYPEEDHYDNAANKNLNCQKDFPSCPYSIWTDMF